MGSSRTLYHPYKSANGVEKQKPTKEDKGKGKYLGSSPKEIPNVPDPKPLKIYYIMEGECKDKDLVLWRTDDLNLTTKKTELCNEREVLSNLDELIGPTTYVVVRLSRKALKRPREYEPETPQKTSKVDDWMEYQAVDGPIDLPPALIDMLNNDEFKPESREKFKEHLDGKIVGDQITLPSIGQIPKHFEEGFQGQSFFITEQMMKIWDEFSADSKHSIKRVLSGPMGVGKSYLVIFLAVKAYAEGWLTLSMLWLEA
ncbi:hypothetical protein BGX27_005660 [Mortierella sp. AM989]|nr:hypothetical protein BGX27_005660 [Mortierella sp. AM989]